MIRTQVQLPEPLYREVKRVAEAQDWSTAELLRRGAEYIVRCYPREKGAVAHWEPTAPLRLGSFRAPVQEASTRGSR